jgi:hypothetical protein
MFATNKALVSVLLIIRIAMKNIIANGRIFMRGFIRRIGNIAIDSNAINHITYNAFRCTWDW